MTPYQHSRQGFLIPVYIFMLILHATHTSTVKERIAITCGYTAFYVMLSYQINKVTIVTQIPPSTKKTLWLLNWVWRNNPSGQDADPGQRTCQADLRQGRKKIQEQQVLHTHRL